jgi:hypothetical protein
MKNVDRGCRWSRGPVTALAMVLTLGPAERFASGNDTDSGYPLRREGFAR